MRLKWTSWLRILLCLPLLVVAVVVAWFPFAWHIILGWWPKLDYTPVQTAAVFVAASAFTLLVLPIVRRTAVSGLTRAAWLRRDWDAGDTTDWPWVGVDLLNLPRRSAFAGSLRQIQRVQRALIRRAAPLGLPVITVQPTSDTTFETAVATATSRHGRLARTGWCSRWDQELHVLYIVDLTAHSWVSTPQELGKILDTLHSWDEIWPNRSVVLLTAGGNSADLAAFQVRELPPDPVSAEAVSPDPPVLLPGCPHAEIRGPLLLALTYACISTFLLFVVPGVLGQHVNPLGWLATLLPSLAAVLSIWWAVWPPSAIVSHPARWAAIVVVLAIALCLGQFARAPNHTPPLTQIWGALGSTMAVAGLLLLAFRRRPLKPTVRRPAVLLCLAILLAAWLTVAADPMLLAVGLLGAFVATTEHFAARAETIVLAAAAVVMGIDVALHILSPASLNVQLSFLGIHQTQTLSDPVQWSIFGPVVVLETVVLLRLLSGSVKGTLQRRPPAVLAAVWWVLLWAAAPLQAVAAGLATSGIALDSQNSQTILLQVSIAAGLASVMLGIIGFFSCARMAVSAWVIRLSLALPIFAGQVAFVGQASSATFPSAWAQAALGVLLLAAVLLPSTEPSVQYLSLRIRDLWVALLLLAGVGLALAALLPWLVDAVLALFGTFPVDDIPGPVRWVFFEPQLIEGATHAFQSPAAAWTVLLLMLAAAVVCLLPSRRPDSRVNRPAAAAGNSANGESVDSPTALPRWKKSYGFGLFRDGTLGRAKPGGVHVLAALATGLLLTAQTSDLNSQVIPGLYPLLWLEHGSLLNLVGTSLCILICISAWLWRHGPTDWIAPMIILALSLLGLSNSSSPVDIYIGLFLSGLFVGGPSTVLAPRRANRFSDLAVCLLATCLCIVVMWVLIVPRNEIKEGNISVPEIAVIALLAMPLIIIREGAGSPMSLRVDRFRRGARRVPLLVSTYMFLTISSAMLTLPFVTNVSLTASDIAEVVCWSLWALVSVYGWLHLGIFARSVGSRHRPSLAGLRQAISEEYNKADESVAASMPHIAGDA